MAQKEDKSKTLEKDSHQRPKFRANYTGRERVTLECKDPSLTKQSLKDETNINNIVQKYSQTGVLTHVNTKQPIYEDISEFTDFYKSQLAIKAAEQSFSQLPAKIRSFFKNDPGQLIAFLNDRGNSDKAIELGLIEKLPEGQPAALKQEIRSGSEDKGPST